jgi:probable rRNA maturation factor
MPHAGHERRPPNVEVSIAIEQSAHAVDESQLREVVTEIVADSPFESAAISVAVVDDPTIQDLNRRFLEHDYPTDVLSFALNDEDGHLEGEIVVSAETAARVATEVGWPSWAELLLYVIHGTLHLVGYDDKRSPDAAEMRAAESRYLARYGIDRREDSPPCDGIVSTASASGTQGGAP